MSVHEERASLVALIAIENALGGPLAVDLRNLLDAGDAADAGVSIGITQNGDGEAASDDEECVGRGFDNHHGAVGGG